MLLDGLQINKTRIMREIKVLHLEPTDVCQAACPLCLRETDIEFNKKTQYHLTLSQILAHCNESMIDKLDKMFMCGNYGDPAAGQHTLEIYRYFRKINPNITLGMNSNGALQSTEWWKQLGSIFSQPKDYVVFSIDGLKDTNHLYRVNVNWDKLIKNIQAFISTGGQAHWDMLVYKHNQHQVEECKKLAKDLGFSWFRAKVSKRPLINILEFPSGWQPAQMHSTFIDCHALRENSVFIDAQGRLSPCCWLGCRQSNFVTDFELIKQSWNTDAPDPTCVKTCGSTGKRTHFLNQWQQEIRLK